MARPFKASDLIVFGDTAAGHDGFMTYDSGAVLVKPCTANEADFYESARNHAELATLMPTFIGRISLATAQEKESLLNQDPMSINAALQAEERTAEEILREDKAPDAPSEHAKGTKIKTNLAIALENIAAGFVKPNVMDVKLGARLYDDDAPEAKRVRLSTVSNETTSGSLGMRIAGMRVWRPRAAESTSDAEPQGEYKVFEKGYGRAFTSSNIQQGFEEFFYDHPSQGRKVSDERRAVLELCEAEIGRMEETLASEETRIYSSSILFVFEGDATALSKAFDEMDRLQRSEGQEGQVTEGDDADDDDDDDESHVPKIFNAKLIDFAHARWTPGQGPDTNMLQGVRSTRDILKRMLDETK